MSASHRVAVLVMGAAAIGVGGCGSLDAKQVRVESGAIASTASEAAELADQRIRGRVPLRFTRAQSKTLATQFGKSLQAATAKPAQGKIAQMARRAAGLALLGQQEALTLSEHSDDKSMLQHIKGDLAQIGERADALSQEAEAQERQ